MTKLFYILILIIFPIAFWLSQIIRHWRDRPRLRTWYWRIWWNVIGNFYPISWWWQDRKKKKQITATVKTRHFAFDDRKKVEIEELIKKTPNGRHAWYKTNVGIIRKPIQP